MLVFTGGVIGTLARVAVLSVSGTSSSALFVVQGLSNVMPWRLIAINTVGVFLAAYALSGPLRGPDRAAVRALVVPGVLGGLTSYSALIADARPLWHLSPLWALAGVGGSILAGILASLAGRAVAR